MRLGHALAEQPDRFLLRLVGPPAVGRLDEEVVAVTHRRRIADDRRSRPAEVSAEDDGPRAAVVARVHADDRRAEDVTRVEIRGADARRDLELAAVFDPLEPAERGLRVPHRVQRLAQVGERLRLCGARRLLGVLVGRRGELGRGRAVLEQGAIGMPPLEPLVARGELLLQLRGVKEHELGELRRAARREDAVLEAERAELRDEAAVVEMCVRQQERVDRPRVVRVRDPVADHVVRAALEHAAVDEHTRTIGLEQVLGPRHRPRGAEEVQAHSRMMPR